MPWSKVDGSEVEECSDDQTAVVKDDDGAVEGCHDTEEEANDQIAALEASEDDRAVSDVDLSPPASMVNAAQMGLRKKDEMDLGDCGTGSGETSARMIVNDEIAADRMRKIAAYLVSHAEDWPEGETPSTISDEQLQDGCGPIQYLLWGGGTDTAYNWALRKANAIADEQGDSKPYSDSDFRSMTRADVDDLSEGDLVSWDSSGGAAYGRVDMIAMGETVSGSLEPEDTEHETSEDNPGLIIELVTRDDEGEIVGEGDTVFHRPETVDKIDESDVPKRSAESFNSRQYEGRSYQSRITNPEIRSTADGKVTVMIATDQIARDGMVLDPKGIDTSAYEQNPVVLWEHGNHPDGGSVPIGRAPDLKEKSNGYLAEVEFDENDEFANEIKRKVEDGFINAVSIGWHTEKVKREERSGEMVPVVKEADMTEFSFVGVPADTEALVQSRMHYPEDGAVAPETTFASVCKGLIELEAARRSMDGQTHAQALQSVKDDINAEVMGGMKALKGVGCPFEDMPTPTDGFESLADVLQVEANTLMQAAAVDGCSYDRSMKEEDRTEDKEGDAPEDTDERSTGDEDSRDCGCGNEGTPSSPSASDGTPADAERDESPGIDELIDLAQQIGPDKVREMADAIGTDELARLVDEHGAEEIVRERKRRAQIKAGKDMGVL